MQTQRDIELFSMLSKYGVMTTRQIAEELFKGIARTTVLRRLRYLESEEFLTRIPGLVNSENAWAMTRDGAKFVADRPPKWNYSRFNLDHDVKLTSLRLSLERLGVVHSWIPEHEIRHKVLSKHGLEYGKRMVIPDGILGCKIQGAIRSLSIELELNYKNKDRYRRMFQEYKWKSNIYGVWYFTPSPSLAKTIEKAYREAAGTAHSPKFFWSSTEEIESNSRSAKIYWGQNSKIIA